MINKLFGKYAGAASTVALFAVGGSLYVGWIDAAIAGIITSALGVHAGASQGFMGGKK